MQIALLPHNDACVPKTGRYYMRIFCRTIGKMRVSLSVSRNHSTDHS
jgi:hypothetical protein